MYDLQRLGKTIADIQKYIKELDSYKINKTSDLEDSKNFNASSMVMFAILNRVIDLGGEIISVENLGAPNVYQEIFPSLAKGGIINKDQATNLNKLVAKRNILAHFYEDISQKELLSTIKEVPLIEEFIKIVKKRINLL